MKFKHNFRKALQIKGFRGKYMIYVAGVLVAAIGIMMTLVMYTNSPATPSPTAPGSKQNTHTRTSSNNSPAAIEFQHLNIVTTVFWVGEDSSSDNGYISNVPSAWDENWQQHYGGVDEANHRKGYLPAGFTPKENPFYVALPYNDIDSSGNRKKSAAQYLPLAYASKSSYSWFKNTWIAIRSGDKIAYAQWEDVGPFGEDDTSYVFGSAKPRNAIGQKAGLDLSPAVRDYLGVGDVSKTDWAFVSKESVPEGPWLTTITTLKGDKVE